VCYGYNYRVSTWRSTNTYILRKPSGFRGNRQYEFRGYRYNRKTKAMIGVYLYNPSPTYHGVEYWVTGKFRDQWKTSGYKAVVEKK